MSEKLAGRGEGLKGLAKGWLQVCDKIMAGKGAAKADAEDLAYADGLRHCAADVKVALEAAARLPAPTAEYLALLFHATYERLAPQYGYVTRKESAVEWEQIPENNRKLMIAVCEAILLTERFNCEAAALATPSPQAPPSVIVPFCIGYPNCDGDLEGEEHSEQCRKALEKK